MSNPKVITNIEVESKFQIIALNAAKIIDQLATIKNLGSYKLGAANTVEIQDTYFDTQELALSKIGAVLRTRLYKPESIVVTLKLNRPSNNSTLESTHRRLEIEAEPTVLVLEEIWKNLTSLDIINQPFSAQDFYLAGVDGIFQKWGLHIAFSANNQRRRRIILDDKGVKVANLDLDTVLFQNSYKNRQFFEIEIEAEKNAEHVLSEITSFIQRQYPNQIEPSQKSKYQQGLDFVGQEDDFKVETKLKVDGNLDEIINWIKAKKQVSEFDLGTSANYKISDSYYDTSDFKLKTNNCYLRLRNLGTEMLLTFRRYKLIDEQIVDTIQIKETATTESLLKVINYLIETQIISVNPLILSNLPKDLAVALATFSLNKTLAVDIDRVIFPVIEDNRHFANLKLDKVTFISSDKKALYNEIELSITSKNDLIKLKALAYGFMAKFALKPTDTTKYIRGLALTQLGSVIDDGEQPLRVYTRQDMIEGIAVWAKVLVNHTEVNEVLQESFSINSSHPHNDSYQELKQSIELAIERSQQMRNIQGAAAMLLFVFGLVIIIASIFAALQGQSFTITVFGLGSGGVTTLLVYYPLQQFINIQNRIISLTTLGDTIRLSLEQFKDDPVLKDKYIQQMWVVLRNKE